MDKDKLRHLSGLLNQAKVKHGMALKGYEGFMTTLSESYGLTTIKQAQKRLKELDDKILQNSNEQDALLADAQGILEKPTMEGNHGNTRQTNVRQAPRTVATGRNEVVGRERAGRTPQSPRKVR